MISSKQHGFSGLYSECTFKAHSHPSDSVTVTITFDEKNGYAAHSAHHSAHQISKVPPAKCYVDGVTRCERAFRCLRNFKRLVSNLLASFLLENKGMNLSPCYFHLSWLSFFTTGQGQINVGYIWRNQCLLPEK